ncbi:hypothetical protein [Streptomyces sp. NPDC017964]|uniref:hypothetical protein n=1 Tax=Streptomyces sp. NPDC017964 TaxID=3365022 RepID=UPI00379D9376
MVLTVTGGTDNEALRTVSQALIPARGTGTAVGAAHAPSLNQQTPGTGCRLQDRECFRSNSVITERNMSGEGSARQVRAHARLRYMHQAWCAVADFAAVTG